MISEDTLVSGIKCNKCQVTLPPHTAGEHRDVEFMNNLHNCDGIESTLIKLARFQYNFSGMKIQEIWGEDKYHHYGKKWVESENNLLDFFVSLDQGNRKMLLSFLEKESGLC